MGLRGVRVDVESHRADRHGDPNKAPWLARRLTDEELDLTRRFRNCGKFAERLTEHDAEGHVADVGLEAGGMRYRITPIGDEQ